MKKIIAMLLVLVLALGMFAGCGAKEDDGELNFTLVSPLVGHPYWNTVENGMNAGAEEYGVSAEYVGPTEISVEEQIKYMEIAIAEGVDGIITMALDPDAFVPVIADAKDAGIPVVLIDTDAPNSQRDYYAGTSNYDAGVAMAEAMIEATGGKAQIGVITGAINASNLIERLDGFKAGIKDYPDMKILAVEPSDTDLTKATQKAELLISTYPEMDAMIGLSATDIQGAAIVVVEQDKVEDFTLVGFDDLDETLQYIRDGVVDATLVQNNFEMGRIGVELLYQIINGGAPADAVIDTGVTIVTDANVDSYKK